MIQMKNIKGLSKHVIYITSEDISDEKTTNTTLSNLTFFWVRTNSNKKRN